MSAPKASRRLTVELNKVKKEGSALGITVDLPSNDSVDHWDFKINGPQGSPFQGRIITGTIDFPSEYPHKAPNLFFVPPIYHVNVDETTGEPCLGKLQEWAPTSTMISIFKDLIELIVNPGAGHAVR